MNTHAQNIDLMKHALGKTPDSRHDLWQTYNTAGRALFSAHPWTWKFSNATSFTFTANNASLALPAQCDAVTDVYPTNGIVTRMRVVDINELYRMRSQSQVSTPDYFVATEDWSNANPPARRIHIYPTPTADLAVYLSYTRTWVDAADPGSGTPNIPPDWERALILMARAFAAHIENQTTGVEDQAVNAEIERLIRLDGEKQPNLGRIKAEWQRTRLPDFRVPVASISLANP